MLFYHAAMIRCEHNKMLYYFHVRRTQNLLQMIMVGRMVTILHMRQKSLGYVTLSCGEVCWRAEVLRYASRRPPEGVDIVA